MPMQCERAQVFVDDLPDMAPVPRSRINGWKFAFLGLFALLTAAFFYEKYPKLESRYWPPAHSWQSLNENYLLKVSSVARDQLADDYQSGQRKLPITRTRALIQKWLEMRKPPTNSWQHAWISRSLLEGSDTGLDGRDLQSVVTFLHDLADEQGVFSEPLQKLDQCMVGNSFLEMYDRTKDERYRRAADTIARYLLEEHPATTSGTLPYRPASADSVLLIDAVGMICPFLVRYGSTFNVPAATELGVTQLTEFLEHGLDCATGLPYHGYDENRNVGLGVAGWTRGCGWLCLGMAGTLVYLPADDPRRLEIEGAFKKLVDTMCRYRHEDGLWPWSMRQYRAPQDTSGSAMIAFAIERGVEVGVLDPRLLETSTDVLEAIIKHTTDTGLIDQAQDDAAGVGLYGYEFGPSAWGQASGLALAAKIWRRTHDAVALHPMSSALRTQ